MEKTTGKVSKDEDEWGRGETGSGKKLERERDGNSRKEGCEGQEQANDLETNGVEKEGKSYWEF
ncbi:hypothetical protein T439DRAFT_325035 [Meredithblackwellia eburnea MCA 4105]